LEHWSRNWEAHQLAWVTLQLCLIDSPPEHCTAPLRALTLSWPPKHRLYRVRSCSQEACLSRLHTLLVLCHPSCGPACARWVSQKLSAPSNPAHFTSTFSILYSSTWSSCVDCGRKVIVDLGQVLCSHQLSYPIRIRAWPATASGSLGSLETSTLPLFSPSAFLTTQLSSFLNSHICTALLFAHLSCHSPSAALSTPIPVHPSFVTLRPPT
jgi:hypothetical protein